MKSRTVSPKRFLGLLQDLQSQPAAQWKSVDKSSLDPHIEMLRQWQSKRLRSTYKDFISDSEYRPVCEFFLEDLYSNSDFSQRVADAERLYAILSRYLPEEALTLLADSLELNRLTAQLDQDLLDLLFAQKEVSVQITEDQYVQAYFQCNNYELRVRQIHLLTSLLRQAAIGARSPVFWIALRLAKIPSLRMGWTDVYSFLERGTEACKKMPEVTRFVNAVYEREMCILNRIYQNKSQPFDFCAGNEK
jgi:hypothetical protein